MSVVPLPELPCLKLPLRIEILTPNTQIGVLTQRTIAPMNEGSESAVIGTNTHGAVIIDFCNN